MAKHLNRSEIKAIKHIILTWDGKITWSDLCESVYKNLNRTITRQSLSAHDEVVEAYRIKKSLSNLKKSGLKKPANLTIAAQQIINLKAENEMLKKQRVEVTADSDLELAVCSAPGKGSFPARLIRPEDVGVEHRGKGRNQRRVHNILPDSAEADCLLVVEVYTDEGATSSWPSHKHDTAQPGKETQLEETYYHRFDPPQGFAFQRVYTDDRSLDACMAPYNHDVVMVPRGYHPVAAIAGYDSYYLNVMAGPDRKWLFTWEDDHAWINTPEYPRHD